MSDTTPFGFGKFVPGFDFLQNLTKGSAGGIPQMPSLSSWVAPTLSVEELDKRVTELKAVQFWLEQNSRALAATIQALEVQKMTLATLKGMNFSMGDVANAFKLKTEDVMGGAHKASENLASAAQAMGNAAARAAEQMSPESTAFANAHSAAKEAEPAASVVDPMQWWGALTQQFQQIASTAMTEAAKQGALDTTRHMATDLAKEAFKTATDIATKGVQSVQEATLRATTAAKAATAAVTPAPVRKTTAAKPSAAAKDPVATKPAARKPAAAPAAGVAPVAKKAARSPASKSAR